MFNKITNTLKEKLNKLINNGIYKKVILSAFAVICLVFSYCVLNYSKLVSVYNTTKNVEMKLEDMDIAIGGEAVGIKLLATGVLVMGIDRDDTNLQVGDVILSVNGNKIESNAQLITYANESEGKELTLKIDRQGKEVITSLKPKYDEQTKNYRLELWVKDSSAGVGTITFYDKKSGKFGALGHGVTETKDNYILPILTGGITTTNIYSIKKGESKVPGELKGTISNDIIGNIMGNTDKGIYGEILNKESINKKESVSILPKSKVKEGEAKIISTLDDNEQKSYKIQIEKVLLTSTGNKNMIIRITDEELIKKTGGIIQGMSGSPIIQDGKLVGAVTHVFLNDPTRGYGVFIENMIEDMCAIK